MICLFNTVAKDCNLTYVVYTRICNICALKEHIKKFCTSFSNKWKRSFTYMFRSEC